MSREIVINNEYSKDEFEYKVLQDGNKRFLHWRDKVFGPYRTIEKVVVVDGNIVYQANDAIYVSGNKLRLVDDAVLELVLDDVIVVSYVDVQWMIAAYDMCGRKLLQAERTVEGDIEDGCLYKKNKFLAISLRFVNYDTGEEQCVIYTNQNKSGFKASNIVYRILDAYRVRSGYIYVYEGFGRVIECERFVLYMDKDDKYVIRNRVKVYKKGAEVPYFVCDLIGR
jgi:hypothetical protein